MNETNTYQNWRAVTEADFVSLFIKTWFAYISTLRVMFPEAKNKRGDGKYLKCYKEHYKGSASHRLIVDDQVQSHIETVYSQGRKIIMEQFPEYYLWDYYRVNERFDYTYKDIPPDKSDCLVVGIKMNKNRGSKWGYTLSGFFRFWGMYYKKEYSENVKFKFDISGILSSSADHIKTHYKLTEQDFLSWLLREINSNLSHQIVEACKEQIDLNKYDSRICTKINEIEKRAISIVWNVFQLNGKDETNKTKDEMNLSRDTYEIVTQLPINYYQYHFEVPLTPQEKKLTALEERWFKKLSERVRDKSVLWFLDFVYRLRNALFHEIIDPLNSDWQLIFKNAYLVLKEIVDLNVDYIESHNSEVNT